MNACDLTFGVEVECGVPYAFDGDIPLSRNYHDRRPTIRTGAMRGWKSGGDISVHVSGATGAEFVSPPLKGEKGLRRVSEAMCYMEEHGFIANSTCGLHINIGLPAGRPYTEQEMLRVKAWFNRFEEGVYSLMGIDAESRKLSTFARPATEWFDTYGWSSSKYQTLNFSHAMRTDGSARLEFRIFAGRINSDYVIDAILLSAGIVAFALTTTVNPLREQMSPIEAVEAIARRVFGRFDPVEQMYPFMVVPDASAEDTALDLRRRAAERMGLAIWADQYAEREREIANAALTSEIAASH